MDVFSRSLGILEKTEISIKKVYLYLCISIAMTQDIAAFFKKTVLRGNFKVFIKKVGETIEITFVFMKFFWNISILTFYISGSVDLKLKRLCQTKMAMSRRFFLVRSGTLHSSAGSPMGIRYSSFSLIGRFKSVERAGPQFNGVLISEYKPDL